VRLVRLGATAITTEINVLRGEELLLQGRLRHVFVSTETWRKTAIPDWVRSGLRRFAAEGAEERGPG